MHDLVEVRLVSDAIPADKAQVQRLEGHEEIGRPFSFEVVVVTADSEALDESALLTNGATIEFLRQGTVERRVYGAIWSVRSSLQEDGEHLVYKVDFGPRLNRLAYSAGSEVFLDKSVVDIIKLKLERASLNEGVDFDVRLLATYPQRDLVMQYAESDLAFVSRLCEHWGISITFEHAQDKDVVVFTDDNGRLTTITDLETVSHHRRGETRGVYALEAVTRTLPATYVVDDYNYRTPSVGLRKEGAIAAGTSGTVTEFGPHSKTPDESELFATARAQEVACGRHVIEGKSDETRLRAGGKTTLEGHATEDGEILIVAVHHQIELPVFGRDEGHRKHYRCDFRAIPAATPFRAERRTPRPKIHGVITAVIESAGGDQYAELDSDGRYHVRLKLDSGPAPKGKASKLVRMAQPHAGAGYGFHFPLRSGVEVMLTCIDGDPDRPIIAGAVPNPQTPSVVTSSNGMRNIMRWGGGSEFNVDDKQGSTRIKMTTPFGSTTFQMGAEESPAQGFYLSTDNDFLAEITKTITMKAGQSITFKAGTFIEADAGSTISATAGDSVSVKASGSFISMDAATKITGTAPEIDFTATAIINEKAPIISMKADGLVATSAPTVTVDGSAVVAIHSGGIGSFAGDALLTLSSGVQVAASGPIFTVDGTTITITGATSVTVAAPTVTVNAGTTATVSAPTVNVTGATTTTVSGPTVNVNGTGTVNVTGGSVKLNC